MIPTQEPFQEPYANSYGYFNYGGNLAINIDDLLFRDPADGNVKPMAYLTTANYPALSSQWLLQRYAKKYFAGTAGFAKLASSPAQQGVLVKTDVCVITNLQASALANAGDAVMVALAGGNAGCLSDTIYNLNSDGGPVDPALAIGRIVTDELYSVAGTKVKSRLLSSLVNGQAPVDYGVLTATIPYTGIGNITGAGPFTGTFAFTQKLPPGAIVLDWEANVTTAFAGASITAVTLQVGTAGTAGAFSAVTNGSVFAKGQIGSAAAVATANVNTETAPVATFTLTGGNTPNAGSLTLAIRYACPLSP